MGIDAPFKNDPKQEKNSKKVSEGRWSSEEHQKFLEGWKLYKNNWTKLQEHIGSRDATQIRSHAQKYHNKVFYEETHKMLQERGKGEVLFQVHKSKKRLRPRVSEVSREEETSLQKEETNESLSSPVKVENGFKLVRP